MEARAIMRPSYSQLEKPEVEAARPVSRRWALGAAGGLAGAAALAFVAFTRRGGVGAAAGAGTLRREEVVELEEEGSCSSKFRKPEKPDFATALNGVRLDDVCIKGDGPHHVFIIGDWGGIQPGRNGNNMPPRKFEHIAPADHTTFGGHMREYVGATDEWAQFRVASEIQKRAEQTGPDYFLNAGDAFYWGGVETHCGTPVYQHAHTSQWKGIFEDMYSGKGVDGKQWLGVLGNHDYGGWMYLAAWDQIIGYTWGGPESTGRWMLPAQYYKASVYYDDFAVEYYFVDSNYFDSGPSSKNSGHNPCNGAKVALSSSDTCGAQGPTSAEECYAWFKKLWEDQKEWLDRELTKSQANWQILVTHFPPTWGKDEWPAILRKHGVDLMITGHKHQQEVHVPEDPLAMVDGWSGLYTDFLGGTGWIVSGGGGGVTCQGKPDDAGHDDQYGFMELSLERYKMTITSISHGGHVRSVKHLHPIPPAVPSPDRLAYLTREQVDMAKPDPETCGTKKYTFYVYRAQDESTYKDQNVNAANLAGVLWYLHHEVVMECPRKFGITRIRRLKVTMQNTCDLYKETKTQFGPYVAFDSGRCGVDGCEKAYYKYGSIIGCQHMPFDTGIFSGYCEYPNCGYARWYSFPGPCTKMPVGKKTEECKADDPGGFCESVTGERDCTYHFEEAGDLSLDELYKTTTQYYPWKEFCKSQLEYNNKTDYGIGVKFWNGIYNPARCMSRYLNITAAFKRKYPHLEETLPEPHCDYYKTDPGDYFSRTGSGFSRNFMERQLGS
mmetsp:Transcript_19971/g.54432  ORF Transcript_19971/g.54432 Transcript_19971/m.54432 type:complete len:779 (-) Transcript_19971:324-2660(-)